MVGRHISSESLVMFVKSTKKKRIAIILKSNLLFPFAQWSNVLHSHLEMLFEARRGDF